MIEPHNVASLRTLRRSADSTRTVGEIRYLKLGSRRFSLYVPGPPPTR